MGFLREVSGTSAGAALVALGLASALFSAVIDVSWLSVFSPFTMLPLAFLALAAAHKRRRELVAAHWLLVVPAVFSVPALVGLVRFPQGGMVTTIVLLSTIWMIGTAWALRGGVWRPGPMAGASFVGAIAFWTFVVAGFLGPPTLWTASNIATAVGLTLMARPGLVLLPGARRAAGPASRA